MKPDLIVFLGPNFGQIFNKATLWSADKARERFLVRSQTKIYPNTDFSENSVNNADQFFRHNSEAIDHG